MTNNLYLVTNKIKQWYVIAPDPTSAKNKLEQLLNSADYSFSNDRMVTNIELLANECIDANGDLYFSGNYNKLIINTL